MSSRMFINQLLSELGYRNGKDFFVLDDDGECIMKYKNKFNVVCAASDADQVLHLNAILMPAMKERATVEKKLLESNFLCLETRGATFAINGKNGDVVLCRSISIDDLDVNKLERYLNDFIHSANEQHKKLHRWIEEGPGGSNEAKRELSPGSYQLNV